MTDDEAIALGRRAVVCRGWRWMRGMVDVRGRPCNTVGLDGWPAEDVEIGGDFYGRRPGPGGHGWVVFDAPIPDLRDPAVIGCLLALAREAWGEPLCTTWTGRGWSIYSARRQEWPAQEEASEAEALVAALEAAPR